MGAKKENKFQNHPTFVTKELRHVLGQSFIVTITHSSDFKTQPQTLSQYSNCMFYSSTALVGLGLLKLRFS